MTKPSYPDARAVESAIKDAAKRSAAADPSLDVNERIRLEYFNRFLSRVFSEAEDSEWVLKGGTGMLARVPSTRATRDVDLYRRGFTLTQALDDLIRLAAIDLGDHFRFQYVSHTQSIGHDTQPYTEGCQVRFEIFIGLSSKGSLQVDLAVGTGITGEVTTTDPANALELPRLVSHQYRLYPVVDQIADKVCATLALYNGRPSSREWDLVDLVVLAVSEDVEGIKLRRAIVAEARVRNVDLPNSFVVPSQWGRRYAKDARPIPACADFRSIDLAVQLMQTFLEPVFRDEVAGQTWNPANCAWTG